MFVGIDVSKAYLDVFIRPTSQRMRLGNDEPGIAQLVGHLESVQPTLVVLEPTGGLQTPVVAALVVRHIPVAVVNPARSVISGRCGPSRVRSPTTRRRRSMRS